MASGDEKGRAAARNKADFANPALGFVNRVLPRRSERILVTVALIATLFCGLSGPFGTFDLPLVKRLAFWALLFGINTLLWAWWFRFRLDEGRSWKRVAAEGAVLFALPMPAEIELAGRLIGVPMSTHWPSIWLNTTALAAIISLVLLVTITTVRKRQEPKGILWREGFGDGLALACIRAEDHFCRLIGRSGEDKLVYARFADLMEEVSALDGLVVRRGCWVAADAVKSIDRVDRKWQIDLGTSEPIAVPAGQVAILREAGWI